MTQPTDTTAITVQTKTAEALQRMREVMADQHGTPHTISDVIGRLMHHSNLWGVVAHANPNAADAARQQAERDAMDAKWNVAID